jgi:nucleolar complex protein 2
MKRKFSKRPAKPQIEAVADFDSEDFQDIDKYLQEEHESDLDQDLEDLYQNFPQSDLVDQELLELDQQAFSEEDHQDVGKREFVSASCRAENAPSESEESDESEEESPSLSFTLLQIQALEQRLLNGPFTLNPIKKGLAFLQAYLEQPGGSFEVVVAGQQGDESLLQRLVIFLFQSAPAALEKYLEMKEGVNWWEQRLPFSHPKWKACSKVLKVLFEGLEKLISELTDSSSLLFLLCVIQPSLVFLRAFSGAFSNFSKSIIGIWSRVEARACAADEKIKVAALLILRKISLCSKVQLERLLKGMYLKFAAASKSVTPHNICTVNFLMNSMMEIYCLDAKLAYHYAFLFIRQLALSVRALVSPSAKERLDKSVVKRVFSWQFLFCMKFWCKFLAVSSKKCVAGQETLALLVYPVVQISMAVLNLTLKTKQQYFPFFLAIIRQLNELAIGVENTFIPTASFVLSMIETMNNNHSLVKSASLKPFDLSTVYKVSKAWINTRLYFDLLLEECSAALLESFAVKCVAENVQGFQEYSTIVISRLKRIVKQAKNPKVSQHIEQVICVLRQNQEYLASKKEEHDHHDDAPLVVFWANYKKTMDLKKKMAADEIVK